MIPVRVLHLIPTLASGGAERQLLNLVSTSSNDVIEHVVVMIGGDSFFASDFAKIGCRVLDLGIHGKHPFISAALQFRRVIKNERPNVINSWLYDANVSARLAGLGLGIPIVTSLQSADYDPSARDAGNWNPHKVRGLRWIDKITYELAKPYFVACSKFVKASYSCNYGIHEDKTVVIYNAVNSDSLKAGVDEVMALREELDLPADAFVFLNVGRLDRPKNHKIAIDAFSKIAGEIPQSFFLIAGNGPLESQLGEHVRSLKLDKRIRLLGRRSDIGALLRLANVFVFPSLLEGLPVALAEAMFAGLPCVASRIEVFEEIVTDGLTGLLVDPSSQEELMASMLRLYNDTEFRQALGENAQRFARLTFNAFETAKQWEGLYTRLAIEANG